MHGSLRGSLAPLARSAMINGSTVFALHCFVLPCVPIKMLDVGLLDFRLLNYSLPYFPISYPTLPRFDIQLIKP